MKKETRFGFVRIGTAVPKIRVPDTAYNANQHIKLIHKAMNDGVDILGFPELSLTGYTAKDLFHWYSLIDGAQDALVKVAKTTRGYKGLVFVGLPMLVDGALFNCAAAISDGKILGIVPKRYPPNNKNFEELRWFRPGKYARSKFVKIGSSKVPFGIDLLFECRNMPGLVVGCETCEDLWTPVPPSSWMTMAGATVIMNLSASNEEIGKAEYRKQLMNQAARCICAYGYTSSGCDESSTDNVFGGHVIISENGAIFVENDRFEPEGVLRMSDIDLERLIADRMRTNSFHDCASEYTEHLQFRRIEFSIEKLSRARDLMYPLDAHPFVPKDPTKLAARCQESFNIQVTGTAKRIFSVATEVHQLYGTDGVSDEPSPEYLKNQKVSIGVSGGLDSTLALLALCKAFDRLGIPRKNIQAYTMPGFGTTKRTKKNALRLMQELGVTIHEVDIRKMCYDVMKGMGHDPFGISLAEIDREAEQRYGKDLIKAVKAMQDEVLGINIDELEYEAARRYLPGLNLMDIKLAILDEKLQTRTRHDDVRFENVQARMRTLILMQAGFVVGTGDLSELAKGWCTFNADQIAMYNPNCTIPKTLVKFLVNWVAHNEFDGETRATLLDIVDTEISPELLPPTKDGKIDQKTEDSVGPYELTDFFMYNLLRFGFRPEKLLYLAQQVKFDGDYSVKTLRWWLCDFIERFFRSQFKRSTAPDGCKTAVISLSPRGDWRMPSDACAALWLAWLTKVERARRIAAKLGTRKLPPVPPTTETGEGGSDMTKTTTTTGALIIDDETALVIVDALNDFGDPAMRGPKGEVPQLPVPEGDQIGPVIGKLQAELPFGLIIAGCDDHDPLMFNFASQNPDKTPYIDSVADRDGELATVYPDHCVRGTWGAGYLPGVNAKLIEHRFPKGDSIDKDSYSICGNPDVIPILEAYGIKRVLLVGLVERICIGHSAIDLARHFEVWVCNDGVRDLTAATAFEWVLKKMDELGVKRTTSKELLAGK